MKTAPFFMICVFLMFCGAAEATSRKTALTAELVNLGRFIVFYHDQEGKYPQTWAELEKITAGLDQTFSTLKPTQRMMLMSPPLEMPEMHDGGGMALAITREPFRPKRWTQWPFLGTTREYLGDPSYAVIVRIDEAVFLRRLPPDAIKSIFEAEGLALPEPSGLGAFPYEKAFMARRIFTWAAAVAFVAWLVWRICQRLKNLRDRHAEIPIRP